MTNIEKSIAASGVIGKFDTDWVIMRVYDRKEDTVCYDLSISDRDAVTFDTVSDALKELLIQFGKL